MLKKGFQIQIFLLLSFISVFSFYAAGQKSDGLKKEIDGIISVRTSDKVQDFLNDKDYLYNTEPAQTPESLWQRIRFWIQQLIAEFLYFLGKGGNLFSYIFYAIVLAVLIFVFMKLLGVSPQNLFLRSKKIISENMPVFEEDINALDFEKIISEAVENENYRKAVRFLYIKFLKILSDTEQIEWKKEKTNKDYKREMKNSKFISEFSKLTKVYEYVWYGEFKIKQGFFYTVFEDFNRIFNDFK